MHIFFWDLKILFSSFAIPAKILCSLSITPLFNFKRKSGAVKLTVSVLEKEKKRQVISVDLGSVYMNQDGENFYWLEKADVTERNKWEVTLKIDLVSGLTARATSRPFRVTTKVHYKRNIQGNWTIWHPLLSIYHVISVNLVSTIYLVLLKSECAWYFDTTASFIHGN